MLSILIPVYNYDISLLVEEIHLQATACKIAFEIIIIDDCSPKILSDIAAINTFPNTKITINKYNIGRSAIRNLLATHACHENLLFIDAGTFPKTKKFIADYIKNLDANITIGGMSAEKSAPKKPYKLRWLYTKKREACCTTNDLKKTILSSANFLIKKRIIQAYPFDESIKKYGFEDYIFFNTLKNNAFHINFISNPVIHDSKEDAHTFILKTEDGLKNLVHLSKQKKTLVNDIRILSVQSKIKALGLNGVIIFIYKHIKPLLIKNFKSSYPSILLFDFYKLGCLSYLISNKE
jgi:glycosyltransferase involved in cell wall biosynthesis